MEQFGSYSKDDKVMGNLLADHLENGYFVIGTDFYKSSCNDAMIYVSEAHPTVIIAE